MRVWDANDNQIVAFLALKHRLWCDWKKVTPPRLSISEYVVANSFASLPSVSPIWSRGNRSLKNLRPHNVALIKVLGSFHHINKWIWTGCDTWMQRNALHIEKSKFCAFPSSHSILTIWHLRHHHLLAQNGLWRVRSESMLGKVRFEEVWMPQLFVRMPHNHEFRPSTLLCPTKGPPVKTEAEWGYPIGCTLNPRMFAWLTDWMQHRHTFHRILWPRLEWLVFPYLTVIHHCAVIAAEFKQ